MENNYQTRWWVNKPVDRFVFEVYVVRYPDSDSDTDSDSVEWIEYLAPDQSWVSIPPYGICQPALSLPGNLELGDSIVNQLTKLARTILPGSHRDAVQNVLSADLP